MYPAPTAGPSPDATPVPIGRRIAFTWMLLGAVSVALAALGTFLAAHEALGANQVNVPFASFARGALLLLLCGTLAFICLRTARNRRGTAIITDFAGLWLTDGAARAVIPWNDVAAIGLHEYVQTAQGLSTSSWSLELRLHDPLDRDGDPLLERMVLPADPPRYMIRLPRGTHIAAMAAVKARVPEPWLEAPDADS
ncbi:hypothetical protein [Glycomyces niveus]|uniref:PH domain-containing protein n=1 Tax=Glycomyces niveus TaxID=2820287 RepID=A0ABS3U7G3_9ACTN|nr:hypothetical protein [Glycomyces sp. NEAU-S30]MBO3734206.1 hypothetical protein [Glycomyces sp. NEAU-S30]